MSEKKERKSKYKNIPVDPITYDMVKAAAEKNRRGLGAQVRVWADQELQKERQAVPHMQELPQPAGQPAKAS
jgi:hypothetical protein